MLSLSVILTNTGTFPQVIVLWNGGVDGFTVAEFSLSGSSAGQGIVTLFSRAAYNDHSSS